jgi:hypothetical protein
LFCTVTHLYLPRRDLFGFFLQRNIRINVPIAGSSFITLSTTRCTITSSLTSITFQPIASRRIASSNLRPPSAVALQITFVVTSSTTEPHQIDMNERCSAANAFIAFRTRREQFASHAATATASRCRSVADGTVERRPVTRGCFLADARGHVLRDLVVVDSLLKLGDIVALCGIETTQARKSASTGNAATSKTTDSRNHHEHQNQHARIASTRGHAALVATRCVLRSPAPSRLITIAAACRSLNPWLRSVRSAFPVSLCETNGDSITVFTAPHRARFTCSILRDIA